METRHVVTADSYSNLEGQNPLTITQDMLIKDIAASEDIDVATIRRIFTALEQTLILRLSSTTQSESTIIKVLNGLSIECNYIPERTIHRYEDITCKARIHARPKLTRYFNRKLNTVV